MNVVILQGCLSSPPSTRTLPSGDTLVTFEVTTRPPDGPAESVPVAWPDAPRRAAALPAGAAVVVTGRVRRRFFRAGGATASRTEVVADAVLPVRQASRVAAAVERTLARVEVAPAEP
ncbi:single-stranded DNA-binding protein [Iamia sp. SCSIO 61187]|uniref:single-stranded DNA-binding protein n=1 Tax=Iamia sp. SCSIO 61187 TaxID=2722752 RepID=UPI001C638DFD|nr:single-stranded DNA-binding protein [Iamia sp. SCSIO 61187]QYG93160.1 single-stranded DNA-binding protein [Iamia sp. SCSIO 61187]